MNGAKFPLTSDENEVRGVSDVRFLTLALRLLLWSGERWSAVNGFHGK